MEAAAAARRPLCAPSRIAANSGASRTESRQGPRAKPGDSRSPAPPPCRSPPETARGLPGGTGGIPADSVLKCEQITTLPKGLPSESSLGRPLSPVLLEEGERESCARSGSRSTEQPLTGSRG